MVALVSIVSRRGLRIEACHRNQPNKTMLVMYKLLLSLLKQLYIGNKTEHLNYKGTCIETFKTRAGLGYR